LNTIPHFSERLLSWYLDHKRDLPWRGESDPYKIWISEVILQQTRVQQGWNYYLKFTTEFPDIATLANAPNQDVMRVWQGLGYYSRARNLQTAAQQIVAQYNGKFPEHFDEIITLKGIGSYTAAAIASIAFGKPYFAADGNVYRVISRLFGILEDINLPKAKNQIQNIGNQLIQKVSPADFTQALMEFGAIHCTPKLPLCRECPFENTCYALKHNLVEMLPVKVNKVKVKNRFFHFLIFAQNDQLLVEQRTGQDIWQNLYQFPLIETFEPIIDLTTHDLKPFNIKSLDCLTFLKTYRHKLTHQQLSVHFYTVNAVELSIQPHQHWASKEQLSTMGFPIVIANFIQEFINR
jgi:A/G-specific adenine glycosylase